MDIRGLIDRLLKSEFSSKIRIEVIERDGLVRYYDIKDVKIGYDAEFREHTTTIKTILINSAIRY